MNEYIFFNFICLDFLYFYNTNTPKDLYQSRKMGDISNIVGNLNKNVNKKLKNYFL